MRDVIAPRDTRTWEKDDTNWEGSEDARRRLGGVVSPSYTRVEVLEAAWLSKECAVPGMWAAIGAPGRICGDLRGKDLGMGEEKEDEEKAGEGVSGTIRTQGGLDRLSHATRLRKLYGHPR
jgi:hypothetical protein